jgi:hypothetical protein
VVLWNDLRTSLFELQIYARTFDGSGAATSGDVRVSATYDYSFLPVAVVAGDEVGVAWTQMAASNDVYFARLGFCE